MIITRLMGGLGNQLFQYAVGRHLAEIHKTELKIDTLGFETYKLHKYSLWPFNIQESFASSQEIESLTAQEQVGGECMLARVLRKTSKPAKTHIREKKLFSFDPKILRLPDGVYLDGYWQTEKYFVDITGIIRQEATVKFQQTGKDKGLADMIASTESISLHIRRGDYVSNPKTKQWHGICGIDYYARCVEHIAQIVQNPHFFIFSDEPEWVRTNLKIPYPNTLVDHNDADKNYEDLRLMSQCRYNIIANSSFSWWGAWLNPRKNKLVLTPQRWLAKREVNCADIIPARWIKK